jgi:hypothetical protein
VPLAQTNQSASHAHQGIISIQLAAWHVLVTVLHVRTQQLVINVNMDTIWPMRLVALLVYRIVSIVRIQ